MREPEIERPSFRYRWGLPVGLFLGLFALYVWTLCPTVFWYDSAEFVVAAVTRGIPHPPGYPLYTLLGALFLNLPLEPAYGMNLMSALFAALSAVALYGICRQLGCSLFGAALGALSFALSRLLWSQALIAEAYAPGVFFFLAGLWLILRGRRQQKLLLLLASAWVMGLGLGVHLSIATCGLGFALLTLYFGDDTLGGLLRLPGWGRRSMHTLAASGAAVLGSTVFLYIPWRAAQQPELNFQNASEWSVFVWLVSGGTYQRLFDVPYEWWAQLNRVATIFYDQYLAVGLLLAVVGVGALSRYRRIEALALVSMVLGNVYFFFNYGVHDLSVFFLPSFAVLGIFIGCGADAVTRWLGAVLKDGPLGRFTAMPRVVLAAFVASLLLANLESVDLSAYRAAEVYGERICRELPPKAMILNMTTPPEWKSYTVFLYFQKVRRQRLDIQLRSRISKEEVLSRIRRGQAIYAFAPVSKIRQRFAFKKEGLLWRLTGPKI